MKRKITCIALVAICCVGFSGCAEMQQKKLAREYDKAIVAMESEQYDEAISILETMEYEDSQELLEKCQREKGMTEMADYNFLEAIEESVITRSEMANNNESFEKCVNYDCEMIMPFKNQEFYDQNLQELALLYIEGLELQKKSITEEKGLQQLPQYEGMAKRFKALKELTDQYGLLEDNVDYKVTYYNEVENTEIYYEGIKAIEEDLDKQWENVQIEMIDALNARIVYKNSTDYTFDMYLHATFFDQNHVIVEVREMYFENIKAHSTYNMDFYFPEKADNFDYYTESYEVRLEKTN